MPNEWSRADDAGWDVEDVDRPRVVEERCPGCGQPSRLIERERVRNLKVLGVPIIATERGGRVFECEKCGERFDVPEGFEKNGGGDRELGDDVFELIEGLEEQKQKARGEVQLWKGRARLAEREGQTELVGEARERLSRAERVVSACEREIERLTGRSALVFATEETAQGGEKTVARENGEGEGGEDDTREEESEKTVARGLEDELAALRERVEKKSRREVKEEKIDAVGEGVERERDEVEDELEVFKKKLKEAREEAPGGRAERARSEGEKGREEDPAEMLKRKLKK